MNNNHQIVSAIKNFIRRAELDPALAKHEGIVYKAALVEQGVDVAHLLLEEATDASIMARAALLHAGAEKDTA